MRNQWKKNTVIPLLTIILLSCGLIPEKVSLDDPRIQPMLLAMEVVDRESLGFTQIPETADVRLELSDGSYDAMLHVDAETRRTVAFRETPEGYRWIGEQETHTGPETYESVDGISNETITITYEIEDISGHPLNRINIRYMGEDPRFADDRGLTLGDVAPVLAEWRRKGGPETR